MALAFDTLGYAKKLRGAGVPQDQAEAHAEAAREFVMAELVTRHDLETVRSDLENRIAAVRTDLEVLRREVEGSIAAVRNEINVLRREVESAMDRLSLRITVRMGVMLAAAIASSPPSIGFERQPQERRLAKAPGGFGEAPQLSGRRAGGAGVPRPISSWAEEAACEAETKAPKPSPNAARGAAVPRMLCSAPARAAGPRPVRGTLSHEKGKMGDSVRPESRNSAASGAHLSPAAEPGV